MLKRMTAWVKKIISINRKIIYIVISVFIVSIIITFVTGKLYQRWDDDYNRGAIAIDNGAFGESYATPIYLDQGWDEADSLWFYNTTQGSALLPYDFFIALEQAGSETLFRDNLNIDKYRYLPQKPTFFNPDGLPVGFVKDAYQGKNYLGYTCAACHTGQINFKTNKTDKLTAIRIDGGPAMADMVGFLTALQESMEATITNKEKNSRFMKRVIKNGSDYATFSEVSNSLQKWTKKIELYNDVNHSDVEYGYARLDAFGRIYNRVLEHVLNVEQVKQVLLRITQDDGQTLLKPGDVKRVLQGINKTVIGDEGFILIAERLKSTETGYPGLDEDGMKQVREAFFNTPSAPVSYPFLWDIAQSDYVQWNGLAANAGVGPLGRNAGEVIGVFGKLDWTAKRGGFNLGAFLSGQSSDSPHIDFKSSINLVNLQRLESHLKSLKSPKWPENILGKIDYDMASRGELIYDRYCESCHEVIDRGNWDRKVIANMTSASVVGTDTAMVDHSVQYTGQSGNFKHVYQAVDGVGNVIVKGEAPVVQILTAATKGVVATPDPDKLFIRRWADWVYTLAMSFVDNDIKASIKTGNYEPDTTAQPYASLASYKARSLNGIWATAPYLHNGSVPTLYDLLLPKKRKGDSKNGDYRPDQFVVGSREFDAKFIGIKYKGFDGSKFTTEKVGDKNTGHEYAAGRTAQNNGETLSPLSETQRWELLEYLKTL